MGVRSVLGADDLQLKRPSCVFELFPTFVAAGVGLGGQEMGVRHEQDNC